MMSITSLGFSGNTTIYEIQVINAMFRHLTIQENFSSHLESKLFITANMRRSCTEQGCSGQATWHVSLLCESLISNSSNLSASSVNEQQCRSSAFTACRICRLGQEFSTSASEGLNHRPRKAQKKVFHERCCLLVKVRSQ